MKMLKFLSSAVLIVIMLLIFTAGDTYNVSGLGNGAEQFEIVESFDQVMLKFSPYMLTDSIGSFHSPPIYVGDCNNVDAYVSAKTNATSDINVLYHVSNDLTNWTAVTPAGLDACSNTAKIDTIGASDSNASMFHHNNYLILEVDGQTGCNTTDRLTLWVNFKKDGAYFTSNGSVIKVCRKIAASVTNP
jgi:hypothetical protein